MKIENAIKKLSKYGKIQENGCEYWIERGNFIIGFLPNPHPHGTTSTCEYTKRIDGEAPERYYDNLTQAINYVLKQEPYENVACESCGRTDLPLHFNRQCPKCFTPPEKAGTRIGNVIVNLLGREEKTRGKTP